MQGHAVARLMAAVVVAVGMVGLTSAPAGAVSGPTASPPPLQCVDNGTSGNRVQLIYAFEPGTSRFAEREPLMRVAAWIAQQNVNDSARRDGAQRWLKFLTTATGCQLVIDQVQVPAGSTNDGSFINQMRSRGYDANGRIYAILSENARGGCAGTSSVGVDNDDTPGTGNRYNTGHFWIVFQTDCFTGHTVTHELAHALGGVLPGAPHVDGGGHCNDGDETLCQNTATIVCPDPLAIRMLDCGRDDYFAVNPQGSYLPTHFNAARDSLYLQAGNSVPALTTVPALPPQLLRALDVEGSSIAFGFTPSQMPQGSTSFTTDFQLLRNNVVVATAPSWRPAFRVTGLAQNSTATYTVRQRVTVAGVTRTSASSQPVTVTTNTSTAPAGQVENGAIMMFNSDVVDSTGPNMAMDLFSFSQDENAQIVQWPANSLANEQWKLTSAGTGAFTVASQHSLKCLNPLNGGTTAGTPVVQTTCNGSAAQRWTFTTLSGVTYQVKSQPSNLCVAAEGSATFGGARLVLATCSSTEPSQRWTANREG